MKLAFTWELDLLLRASTVLELCFFSNVRQGENALLAAISSGVWPDLFLTAKSMLSPQLMRYISKELAMSEFASLQSDEEA